MPATPPKAAPAAAGPPPQPESLPWWVPAWPVCLAVGLYVMSFWLLWILAPGKGEQPSELFKALAEAIVFTAFVNGVVGAVYTQSRESQKKNETIAAQARVIASHSASQDA